MNTLGALTSRCLRLGLAMTLLSFAACGGSDDSPKGKGSAKPKAAAARPKPPARPATPLPPPTDAQIDVFENSFTWDPSKGAERDRAADSQSCIDAGANRPGLQLMKMGIDCMVAKGWRYKAG